MKSRGVSKYMFISSMITPFSRSISSAAKRECRSMSTSTSSATSRCSDRKSTRLNSSHTEIYTLSLHDALPIFHLLDDHALLALDLVRGEARVPEHVDEHVERHVAVLGSEEHTSELQSHRDLHSFPTRRSSDLSSPR